MRHLWVVYDERAALGDTDDATVYESANTERSAMTAPFEGIVYRYDVDTDGKSLINETLIGSTWLLARKSMTA